MGLTLSLSISLSLSPSLSSSLFCFPVFCSLPTLFSFFKINCK